MRRFRSRGRPRGSRDADGPESGFLTSGPPRRFGGLVASVMYVLVCRVLGLATLRFRSRRYKDLEILVLRHELAVLRRQVSRPQLDDADRVFLAPARRHLPRARSDSFLVTQASCRP